MKRNHLSITVPTAASSTSQDADWSDATGIRPQTGSLEAFISMWQGKGKQLGIRLQLGRVHTAILLQNIQPPPFYIKTYGKLTKGGRIV